MCFCSCNTETAQSSTCSCSSKGPLSEENRRLVVTRAGMFKNHSSHNLYQLLPFSSGSGLHSSRQEKDSLPQTGRSESIWGEWGMKPPFNGSFYSLSPATRQEVSKWEQTRPDLDWKRVWRSKKKKATDRCLGNSKKGFLLKYVFILKSKSVP